MRSFRYSAFIVLLTVSPALAMPFSSDNKPVLSPTSRLLQLLELNAFQAYCCKKCRKGKACGDSCISRQKTCRKGAGCACDG